MDLTYIQSLKSIFHFIIRVLEEDRLEGTCKAINGTEQDRVCASHRLDFFCPLGFHWIDQSRVAWLCPEVDSSLVMSAI